MNEIKYNGLSYHGDNSEAWYDLADKRYAQSREHRKNGNEELSDIAFKKGQKNWCNAYELDDDWMNNIYK